MTSRMSARSGRLLRLIASTAATVCLVSAVAAPGAYGATHALIQGSGSSWAANAINQWVADVARNGMQVVFTANGAAQGRKDFASVSTDFGVSDIGYNDPSSGDAGDTSQGRAFAYLPVAAGGTALPYHLTVGGQMVRNLRLSGETVAKIFTGQITTWSDPAVTRDNNGHALPAIPIIPVVHSEGAGVSNQFTRYLAKQYPAIWGPCNGGQARPTEYYPLNCGRGTGSMKAFSGSDGVMNFIKSPGANGSIGIEEYSYPLLANYPAAKLLNSAGVYTLPTQYNVAVALTKAVIDDETTVNPATHKPYSPADQNYLLQNLDNVYTNPDPRTYPLSSYVYAIVPTSPTDARMTTAKRQTLADFLYYSICQGQSEIGPIGYSSLPINLVTGGFTQIGKLKTADKGVDLTQRDVSTCHNPTFIAGQPRVNHLAQIAPQPPSCDRVGAGPCAAGVGAYNGSNPTDAKNAAPAGSTPTSTATPGSTPVGTSPVGTGTAVQNGTVSTPVSVLNATLPAHASDGPPAILSVLAAALLAAVVGAPIAVGLVLRRRRT